MKQIWKALNTLAAWVAAVALTCLSTTRAAAQEGPFVPWQGEKGITETVAQIMERDRITPKPDYTKIVTVADLRGPKQGEPDRTILPMDPNSPNVPFWPYNPALDPFGRERARLGDNAPPPPNLPQTLGTEFNGPTLTNSGYIPPDTQGAVGPTQIVLMANGRITSYTKTGSVSGINTTLDVFFNSVRGGSPVVDPQVKYDRTSGRWIAMGITTSSPNRIVLAVSSGSSIVNTASFTFYFFQQDLVAPTGNTGAFADYGKIGVDANAVYIGANMFGPGFNACTAWVVKKSSILGGGPIEVTAFRNIVNGAGGAGPFAPMGVDNDDPAATEGYIVGVDNVTSGRLVIRRVTNPGGTPSISGNLNITVPTTNGGQSQPALGSTINLSNIDDRLFYAMIKKHRDTGLVTLWTAHHIEVNSSGTASTSGNRLGARWYELQSLTTTPALRQSGTAFDTAGTNPRGYWMPSVAMSGQGHMALGASYAGANDRAGAAVAGRLSGDALGVTQAVTIAEVSASSYNVESGVSTQRWGDYSNVWVDPNDDMTMWAFVEWCQANNNWACRAIQLRAPLPATPASCSPANLAQGSSNVNVVVTGTSVSGSGFFDPFSYYPNRIAAAFSGTGITINSITYNSPTQITLNVSISGSATVGGRTLTVTNPDGQVAASAGNVFTVDAGGSVCPGFTTNPATQTVCSGSPVSFTVVATGTPAPTLQWRRNGSNIGGATSSTYTIASTTGGDAGLYDCVATNSCGSATSAAATLTVNVAPSITAQPTGQTICSGGNVSFTVGATGTPAPTFQWRRNGSNVGGATSSTLTINGATTANAGNYDCVVTNSCGSVTSNIAALTVNVAPTITTQPTSQTICSGSNVSFTIATSGTPTPTVQWRRNGSNISGANSLILTINGATTADAGNYDCVVTNSCGSVTSNIAVLTVNAAPSISDQPDPQIACEGSPASFTVVASGTPAPTFQWRRNGSNIGGATGPTYSIALVSSADAGNYDCVVTNSCGSVTSIIAALDVNTAPTITDQPDAQTVCEGSPASFTVAASGTPAPAYQWRKNGVDIPGEINAVFTILAAANSDAGNYDCVITNSCGNVTSASATLGVNTAPQITTQPFGQSICEGGTVILSIAATGTPAPTYQWQKNGADIPGQTGTTLTLSSVTSGDAGDYACVVSNACGVVTSSTAAVSVDEAVSITSNPSDQTVPEGDSATFTVTATGTMPIAYQWRKDGSNIIGATSATLVVFPVTEADAGVYDCVVSNTCGSQASAGATLTVRCPSDFDNSGFVDGDDFDAFVAAFEIGDESADFDGSGFVDGDDFDAFVLAFESGC